MVLNRIIRTHHINIRRNNRLISRHTNTTYTKAIRTLFKDQLRVYSLNILATGFSGSINLQVFLISNTNLNSSLLRRQRVRVVNRNGTTKANSNRAGQLITTTANLGFFISILRRTHRNNARINIITAMVKRRRHIRQVNLVRRRNLRHNKASIGACTRQLHVTNIIYNGYYFSRMLCLCHSRPPNYIHTGAGTLPQLSGCMVMIYTPTWFNAMSRGTRSAARG